MTISPLEIEERARAMFGEPNRHLSTKKELRFGHKGSVGVALDGDKAGLWYSFEDIKGGTVLRPGESPNLSPARRASSSLLSWDSDSEHRFRQITEHELCRVEDAFTRAPALRMIERAPAHQYLVERGITKWPDVAIRGWHRTGIVYLARTADGTIMACQALPLTVLGHKDDTYWPDGVKKRTYTACRGWHHYAAVRMPGRGEPILCEGVETGLSIWLSTGRPVLACLGMAGVRHLRAGKKVTIAADCDPPGSPAAAALAETIKLRRSLGQRVRVAVPPSIDDPAWGGNPPAKKSDFNDAHCRLGLDAVSRIIRGAA